MVGLGCGLGILGSIFISFISIVYNKDDHQMDRFGGINPIPSVS